MTDSAATEASATGRLHRLLPLLETDPTNLRLIEDIAETAIAEEAPGTATEVIQAYAAGAPLPPQLTNLLGLAAMAARDYDGAARYFQGLVDGGADDPGLSFNLAWCRGMAKDFTGALELLTDEVAQALPQAAMLRVQILHELGELDEAARLARDYVERHPDYPALMAAVSVLAIDVEDEELAARCAARGGGHPDALTTLGTLALGDDRPEEALGKFDDALARDGQSPRAWIGRGLAGLAMGKPDGAAEDIDKGAELFGDHLGSWIAAGWAYFVRGDMVSARARFERALALDDSFGETYGSLAVINLLEGRTDEARRQTEVALRLDRHSYSAALASALLAAGAGDQDKAKRIFELAVNTPVDGSGRTIAQALARRGVGLN